MIERVYFVCTSIASLRLVDCAIALLISRPRSHRLLPNANISLLTAIQPSSIRLLAWRSGSNVSIPATPKTVSREPVSPARLLARTGPAQRRGGARLSAGVARARRGPRHVQDAPL